MKAPRSLHSGRLAGGAARVRQPRLYAEPEVPKRWNLPGHQEDIRSSFARSSRKPGRTSCARGPCNGSRSDSSEANKHDNASHGIAAGGFWTMTR